MRFITMIKATKEYEQGLPPSPELLETMGKLTAEMTAAGVLLSAEGLAPSAAGTRVRYSRGRRSVIDGPFTEAKELVGGFAILQAASKDEAIALAQRVVEAHVQAGVPEVEIEIRPLFDPGTCGETAHR
jgi:hypothetical protein